MRLSRFTDIALRSLLYLGARPGPQSARSVADAYGVSKDHVMKGLQALNGLGVVDSRPGRAGGFSLVADPRDVRLGALIASLEPSMALAECFEDASACPLTPACGLAGALHRAQGAFLTTLDQYTLADLLNTTGTHLVTLESSLGASG